MTQGTGQEGWPVGKVGMKCAWPSQESFHQYTLSTRWRVMWAPGLRQWSCCAPTLQELSGRETETCGHTVFGRKGERTGKIEGAGDTDWRSRRTSPLPTP